MITDETDAIGAEDKFFRGLSGVLPGVIYQSRIAPDGSSVVEYMSESVRAILGCEVRDLVGEANKFRSLIHEEDRARFTESVREQLGRDGKWELDYRLNLPCGKLIWINSQATVVPEGDGYTVWRGFFTDITAKKQAEQDLRAERERLALATDAGHIGAWDTNLVTGETQWNDAMYEIHGVTRESYQPSVAAYQAFVENNEGLQVVDNVRRAVKTDTNGSSRNMTIRLGDGRHRLVRTKWAMIRDAAGKPVRMVGITMDITEEQAAADLLVQAKEAAEAAAKAKSEFLATMSHEIRTPMNGILGYTELLRTSVLNDEQHQFLQTIDASGKHLLSIINDILDVSQIEAGKITIRPAAFEVNECVGKVFEMLRPVAEAKGLTYTWNKDPTLPTGMVSDAGRLAQILTNLLGNAIKFTAAGVVRLSISAKREEGVNWRWEFRISDTGPGISAEALSHIFEPFFQEDNSARRRYGGTGLGLTISRKLAALLGGSIKAESMVESGSDFQFILRAPAVKADWEGETPRHSERALLGRRVLVVEDNPTNRALCGLQLERVGCQVEFAEDGRQALEQFLNGTFDAILMDMQLPHVDGCQATEGLRKMEAENGTRRTPVIAMTANVLTEDRIRCFSAGMDDYLSKPVSQAKLVGAIVKWAAVPPGETPAE